MINRGGAPDENLWTILDASVGIYPGQVGQDSVFSCLGQPSGAFAGAGPVRFRGSADCALECAVLLL